MRNLHPENIRAMGLVLNLENWEDIYDANDVSDQVESFNKIIGNMLDTYTSVKYVHMHSSDKEWMTPRLGSQQDKKLLLREINTNLGDSVPKLQI